MGKGKVEKIKTGVEVLTDIARAAVWLGGKKYRIPFLLLEKIKDLTESEAIKTVEAWHKSEH